MASVSIRLNPVGVLLVVGGVACLVLYAFDVPRLFGSEQKVVMKELLSVAIDLAERGGAQVKAVHDSTNLDQTVKGKTKEGKDELKTRGDDESHKAMVNGFAKAFPKLKVHSEEHTTGPVDLHSIKEPDRNRQDISYLDRHQSIPITDITVWVDPLDATAEYTENLIQYVTTMVCIAVRGQPKIGIIHFPFSKETVWGWVDYGTSPSLKKYLSQPDQAKSPDKQDLPHKIIVSRSHSGEVQAIAQKAFGNQTIIIPAGGAGYKTVQVIKGFADAYVHVTAIKKWDICAGNAIIISASGRMTTLHGTDVNYAESGSVVNSKGLLATLHNHKKFLDNLRPAFDAAQEKVVAPKEPLAQKPSVLAVNGNGNKKLEENINVKSHVSRVKKATYNLLQKDSIKRT